MTFLVAFLALHCSWQREGEKKERRGVLQLLKIRLYCAHWNTSTKCCWVCIKFMLRWMIEQKHTRALKESCFIKKKSRTGPLLVCQQVWRWHMRLCPLMRQREFDRDIYLILLCLCLEMTSLSFSLSCFSFPRPLLTGAPWHKGFVSVARGCQARQPISNQSGVSRWNNGAKLLSEVRRAKSCMYN